MPYLSALAADPQVEPFLALGAADEERMRSLAPAAGPRARLRRGAFGRSWQRRDARRGRADARQPAQPDLRGVAGDGAARPSTVGRRGDVNLARLPARARRSRDAPRSSRVLRGQPGGAPTVRTRRVQARGHAKARVLASWRLARRGTVRTSRGGASAGGAVGRPLGQRVCDALRRLGSKSAQIALDRACRGSGLGLPN